MSYFHVDNQPISFSQFHDNTVIDLNPVLTNSPWNNPIWSDFPSNFQYVNQQSSPGMSVYPWLLGLTLLSNVRSQSEEGSLRVKYSWKTVDFTFPSEETRQDAISSGAFIPSNNLPLGIEVYNGRTFVTLPKWKTGVPATLTVINSTADSSPLLQPYPNWKWHEEGNCNGLTSVFRLSVDACGRLWVLDSGVIDVLNTTTRLCPSQIVVFDLRTDKLLWRYRIPKDQIKESSLFTNIVTDIRNGKCDEAFAYIADVFRYAIVVYDWRQDKSWRISHNFFYPDPIASAYSLDNINFTWTDGVFGLGLSPTDPVTNDRTLYFHPMSSFREFEILTSYLINDTAEDHPEAFKALGEPRGSKNWHSSSSAMDRNGILFYNLVTRNSVGCWDSQKPYTPENLGDIGQSEELLNFPNDIRIDWQKNQNVWILSNKLHKYLYTSLDPEDINFRILTGPVNDLIKGTICDPNIPPRQKVKQCSNDEL